ASEPRDELGVVVLQAEHEADVLDSRLARRADADRAVGPLPRAHLLEPALGLDRRPVDAVEHGPRRVAVPHRRAKRVRPARPQLGRDHRPTLTAGTAGAKCASRSAAEGSPWMFAATFAARSKASIASWSRPTSRRNRPYAR